jgi:hypothetical protein
MTASRLYVRFKRYAFTDRQHARALAFAVIAPLHALAAGARHRGAGGVRDALSAIWLARRYVREEIATTRIAGTR